MRDLFHRLGPRVSEGSFDSLEEPLPMQSSKIEALGYISEFDSALSREDARRARAAAEAQKSASPESDSKDE